MKNLTATDAEAQPGAATLPCNICGGLDLRPLDSGAPFPLVACGSCGLVFIEPRPTRKEILSLYEESYYRGWGLDDSRNWADVQKMKHVNFLPKLRRIESLVQPGRILDVGCATGFFMELAETRGWQAYGIDVNPYAAEVTRRSFGDRVRHGDLLASGFSSGFFDAIFAYDVIEHVEDPRRNFLEMGRILRPGGALYIATPNWDSFLRRLLRARWPDLKLEHLYYFSHSSIARALHSAGFEIRRRGSCWKRLSLRYLGAVMRVYRNPRTVYLASEFLNRVLPERLCLLNVPYYTGEMDVYAIKRPA